MDNSYWYRLNNAVLNKVALDGLNGVVITSEGKDRWKTLLGYRETNEWISPNLRYTILSTNKELTKELQNAANVSVLTELCAEKDPLKELERTINEVKKQKSERSENSEESPMVLFIHLQYEAYKEKAIECIERTIQLIDQFSDWFLYIVTDASEAIYLTMNTIENQTKRENIKANDIVQQSEGRYEGKDEVLCNRYPMFVSMYAKDGIRKDKVTTFNEKDIVENGGYGIVRAEVINKEIAYRMGCAKKYGA